MMLRSLSDRNLVSTPSKDHACGGLPLQKFTRPSLGRSNSWRRLVTSSSGPAAAAESAAAKTPRTDKSLCDNSADVSQQFARSPDTVTTTVESKGDNFTSMGLVKQESLLPFVSSPHQEEEEDCDDALLLCQGKDQSFSRDLKVGQHTTIAAGPLATKALPPISPTKIGSNSPSSLAPIRSPPRRQYSYKKSLRKRPPLAGFRSASERVLSVKGSSSNNNNKLKTSSSRGGGRGSLPSSPIKAVPKSLSQTLKALGEVARDPKSTGADFIASKSHRGNNKTVKPERASLGPESPLRRRALSRTLSRRNVPSSSSTSLSSLLSSSAPASSSTCSSQGGSSKQQRANTSTATTPSSSCLEQQQQVPSKRSLLSRSLSERLSVGKKHDNLVTPADADELLSLGSVEKKQAARLLRSTMNVPSLRDPWQELQQKQGEEEEEEESSTMLPGPAALLSGRGHQQTPPMSPTSSTGPRLGFLASAESRACFTRSISERSLSPKNKKMTSSSTSSTIQPSSPVPLEDRNASHDADDSALSSTPQEEVSSSSATTVLDATTSKPQQSQQEQQEAKNQGGQTGLSRSLYTARKNDSPQSLPPTNSQPDKNDNDESKTISSLPPTKVSRRALLTKAASERLRPATKHVKKSLLVDPLDEHVEETFENNGSLAKISPAHLLLSSSLREHFARSTTSISTKPTKHNDTTPKEEKEGEEKQDATVEPTAAKVAAQSCAAPEKQTSRTPVKPMTADDWKQRVLEARKSRGVLARSQSERSPAIGIQRSASTSIRDSPRGELLRRTASERVVTSSATQAATKALPSSVCLDFEAMEYQQGAKRLPQTSPIRPTPRSTPSALPPKRKASPPALRRRSDEDSTKSGASATRGPNRGRCALKSSRCVSFDTNEDGSVKCSTQNFERVENKDIIWWTRDEKEQIRQSFRTMVNHYQSKQIAYTNALSNLYHSYRSSVTPQETNKNLELLAKNSGARGLEMFIVSASILLRRKHQWLVLAAQDRSRLDRSIAHTYSTLAMEEIREASLRGSRPSRTLSLKLAQHDKQQALEVHNEPQSAFGMVSSNNNSSSTPQQLRTSPAS